VNPQSRLGNGNASADRAQRALDTSGSRMQAVWYESQGAALLHEIAGAAELAIPGNAAHDVLTARAPRRGRACTKPDGPLRLTSPTRPQHRAAPPQHAENRLKNFKRRRFPFAVLGK
jgi:hypothetical protein